MTSPYRGPLIRTDFADVLATIRRDSAPGIGDDASRGNAAHGEAASPDATAHASFDFLRALDTVSEQRSMHARPAAVGFTAPYVEEGAEAAAEEAPPTWPLFEGEQAGASPSASAELPPETCDPISLAAELGLRAGLKPAELKRIRRAFALANHPDRLDPSRREAASRRMTLANSLIDEALRQAKALS
ncbi:MAG: hypothetical protein ACHQAY_01400 [Hyphomicrobiales bacterium]